MIRIDSPEVQEFEKEHLSTLRALAPECMVLLKKNGDFPLSSPCKIALYGAGARETIKGGTGSGDVNVRHYVSVEEGLENAGFTITTKSWMEGYKAAREAVIRDFYEGIAREAKELGKSVFLVGMGRTPAEPHYELPLEGDGEVCIYVLSRNSGEGADRPGDEGDYLLTGDEVRDLLACAEKYPKFMLVLNVGGPVDISPVLDKVENVLLLSQLGSVTGDAFADVLLGKANPSGKLTATWAKAGDIMAIGDFAGRDDTRYREGIFVGYRYYDAAGIKPLFPFGCGLSYTEFETDCMGFSMENGIVSIEAKVQNIGRFPGKETVQLYYSAPNGKLIKPLRELGAYRKTRELLPGESEKLVLELPPENMASWDAENDCWLLEQGEYLIYLGSVPVGTVILDGTVSSDSLSHSGGEADFEDWQPGIAREIPGGLPLMQISASSLGRIGHYDREKASREHIGLEDLSDFSIKELAAICAGKHSDAEGMAAIIGNSAARLAGGAGETASIVAEKGYGAIVMADGPAGLRLATKYMETEDGQEGLDSDAFGSILNILPPEIRQLIHLKLQQNEEKAKTNTVLYHYASAIPIGTALAQAWNPSAVEACGDLGVYGASSPALCIKAGNDLMMAGSKADVDGILTGLKDGIITREELETCAGRILALSKELS